VGVGTGAQLARNPALHGCAISLRVCAP
jgi:hypothetical protein